MKLFLSTDFEGTSGIVAWEQIMEGMAEYEQGRRLLTDEVNAVINGSLEAGVTDIVVNDRTVLCGTCIHRTWPGRRP